MIFLRPDPFSRHCMHSWIPYSFLVPGIIRARSHVSRVDALLLLWPRILVTREEAEQTLRHFGTDPEWSPGKG